MSQLDLRLEQWTGWALSTWVLDLEAPALPIALPLPLPECLARHCGNDQAAMTWSLSLSLSLRQLNFQQIAHAANSANYIWQIRRQIFTANCVHRILVYVRVALGRVAPPPLPWGIHWIQIQEFNSNRRIEARSLSLMQLKNAAKTKIIKCYALGAASRSGQNAHKTTINYVIIGKR